MAVTIKHIAVGGRYIDVAWGQSKSNTRYYSYWLKLLAGINHQYAEVAARWTDGANFQPTDIQIRNGDRIQRATVSESDRTVLVTWKDGTAHVFSTQRLWDEAFSADVIERVPRIRWDGKKEFKAFDCSKVLQSDDELFGFLHTFIQHGIAFLYEVPRAEEQIRLVASRLSTLQPSHLGDTFRVEARAVPSHLGETAQHIPLHMDLVFKQSPPDVQMLHVLDPAEVGGENIFVDSFRLISQVPRNDIKLLRGTPIWFVAESDIVHFRGLHPILEYDARGEFRGVRYNEHKMIFPVEASDEFYFALRRFGRLIRKPENVKELNLRPNSIVLFDNLRVLHGRKEFYDHKRRLNGCFVCLDDLYCKYRLLARTRVYQSVGDSCR